MVARLSLHAPLCRVLVSRRFVRPSSSVLVRAYATGTVSNQPGSSTIKELKQNAKEEARNVTADIKNAISGANDRTSQLAGSKSAISEIQQDLASASSGVVQDVPRGAILFGAAGILPYIGTSATTVYLSRQAALLSPDSSSLDSETALALLHHVEGIQVGYGALILSFIGSIHWGLEFAEFNGKKGIPRYLLGIAPVLIAMPTLLLPGQIALASQFGAFTATWFMDQRATTMGWTPRWYSTYRFWLTVFVGTSLVLTLGGANFLGPGANAATTGRRLSEVNKKAGDKLAQQRDLTIGIAEQGKIGGDIDATEGEDAYVQLTNVPKKEAAEKKKKEEEKKQKAEQDKKDKADAEKAAAEQSKAKEAASASKTPGAVRAPTFVCI